MKILLKFLENQNGSHLFIFATDIGAFNSKYIIDNSASGLVPRYRKNANLEPDGINCFRPTVECFGELVARYMATQWNSWKVFAISMKKQRPY